MKTLGLVATLPVALFLVLGLVLWLAHPWPIIFTLLGLFVWRRHWLRRAAS